MVISATLDQNINGINGRCSKSPDFEAPIKPQIGLSPSPQKNGKKLWENLYIYGNNLYIYISINLYPIVSTYPLVMTNIAMENHHAINGKTHYVNGHFQ